MPTRLFSTNTTTETKPLTADPTRLVAIIQNLGPNTVWISDTDGKAKAHQAIKLTALASITLRQIAAEEPEKDWYAIAEGADQDIVIFEVFGQLTSGGGSGGNGGGQSTGNNSNAATALMLAFGTGGALH